MATHYIKFEFRILGDTVTGGNPLTGTGVYMFFRRASLDTILCRVDALNNAATGRSLVATTGTSTWSGSYSLSTWYTVEMQIVEAGANVTGTIWIDTVQRANDTFAGTLSATPVATMQFSGARVVGGTWALEGEFDNFVYKRDGSTIISDDFADGDLTPWVVVGAGTFYTEEASGVYHGNDSSSTVNKITGRERELTGLPLSVERVHLCRDSKSSRLWRAWEDAGSVHVQSSLDEAETWTGDVTVATGIRPSLTHSAEAILLLSYEDSGTCRVRQSLDGGGTWGSAIGAQAGDNPIMWSDPKHNILHRAYYDSGGPAIKHQSSFDLGATWSTATTVASVAEELWPEGVCFSDGRPLVAWRLAAGTWVQYENPQLDGGGTWTSV